MTPSPNPLVAIHSFGQSIWLDYIRRNILHNGELQRLITEDGLRGVTSNPAIFEKAIAGSDDYAADIRKLALEGLSAEQIYAELAVTDVQQACDLLRPLYDHPENSGDGYVSLEVSPELVDDTAGTVAEGRHYWQVVNRPNVMIKVPATRAGLPAIRQLIAAGVNVTFDASSVKLSTFRLSGADDGTVTVPVLADGVFDTVSDAPTPDEARGRSTLVLTLSASLTSQPAAKATRASVGRRRESVRMGRRNGGVKP